MTRAGQPVTLRAVKKTALALLVVPVLALAGCGLLGGGGITSSQASCNLTADKHCTDFSGLQPATFALAQQACDDAMGSFEGNGKCDLSGSLGGCRRFATDPVKTEWSYPGDGFYGGTLQTPDDVANACDGRYVDTARREWSSDAGLPTSCTNVTGAASAVTFKNVAPLRVKLYHCETNLTLLGDVDAGATFRLAPAVSGDAVWVILGDDFLMKTVTVPATDTTVEIP
jgi:hypothetical protein